ncbi:MAG: 4Fe-4S binding protein [Chloroflexi bacterium]|nr:4Fe-4S binding protein [Chloroflexota bacterium]
MPKVKYEVTRGCTFCNTCIFECPVSAITMTKQGALIDQDKCTGCGTCYNNCAFEAIEKIALKAKS